MARYAPRRDQHGVKPDIADPIIGIARKPGFRRRNDAATLALGDGPRRVVQRRSRLDLDEDQKLSPPRNNIDLSDGALPATRQDAKSLGEQKCRRPALRGNAAAERDLALCLAVRTFAC